MSESNSSSNSLFSGFSNSEDLEASFASCYSQSGSTPTTSPVQPLPQRIQRLRPPRKMNSNSTSGLDGQATSGKRVRLDSGSGGIQPEMNTTTPYLPPPTDTNAWPNLDQQQRDNDNNSSAHPDQSAIQSTSSSRQVDDPVGVASASDLVKLEAKLSAHINSVSKKVNNLQDFVISEANQSRSRNVILNNLESTGTPETHESLTNRVLEIINQHIVPNTVNPRLKELTTDSLSAVHRIKGDNPAPVLIGFVKKLEATMVIKFAAGLKELNKSRTGKNGEPKPIIIGRQLAPQVANKVNFLFRVKNCLTKHADAEKFGKVSVDYKSSNPTITINGAKFNNDNLPQSIKDIVFAKRKNMST